MEGAEEEQSIQDIDIKIGRSKARLKAIGESLEEGIINEIEAASKYQALLIEMLEGLEDIRPIRSPIMPTLEESDIEKQVMPIIIFNPTDSTLHKQLIREQKNLFGQSVSKNTEIVESNPLDPKTNSDVWIAHSPYIADIINTRRAMQAEREASFED